MRDRIRTEFSDRIHQQHSEAQCQLPAPNVWLIRLCSIVLINASVSTHNLNGLAADRLTLLVPPGMGLVSISIRTTVV
jgi:hypothetical protein